MNVGRILNNNVKVPLTGLKGKAKETASAGISQDSVLIKGARSGETNRVIEAPKAEKKGGIKGFLKSESGKKLLKYAKMGALAGAAGTGLAMAVGGAYLTYPLMLVFSILGFNAEAATLTVAAELGLMGAAAGSLMGGAAGALVGSVVEEPKK